MMTCAQLELAFSAPSTSSAAASPVRTSRPLAKARGSKVRAPASGSSSAESSMSCGRASSSSRTSPVVPSAGCLRCGGNCASLGTIRPLSPSQPQMSERPTDAPASSSSALAWPTPTAQSYGSNQGGAAWRTGPVRHSLNALVTLWPTPTVKGNDNRAGLSPTSGDGLGTAVRDPWPTPRAGDGPKGGPNQRGTKGDLALPSAVQPWATPAARDVTRGKGWGDQPERNARPLSEQAAGTLNPEWVEMLMGFPPGWTDIGGPLVAAPASTKTRRRARSKAAASTTDRSE